MSDQGQIYLRVVETNGVRSVVDQDGRELSGVRGFGVHVGMVNARDTANIITIECFEYNEDGDINLNRGAKPSPMFNTNPDG